MSLDETRTFRADGVVTVKNMQDTLADATTFFGETDITTATITIEGGSGPASGNYTVIISAPIAEV